MDSGNNRVVLTSSSSTLGTSGSAGNALGQFQGAVNLCIGARGIYVGDAGNNRVQAFERINTALGFAPMPFYERLSISTQFGLSQPCAIAPIKDLLVEKMYIADTGNNRVIKVSLPETDSPTDVWAAMKTSLVSNSDLNGAISHFSGDTGADYKNAFLSIGISKAIADVGGIGTLTPVFITGDKAQYRFTVTVQGQDAVFPVDFLKEDGKWKISSF